ncbi:MAG TPA: hypothetical protein VFJ73_03260 [Bacillales bacterium]|nr:hypothetical protein [Bacillales bacterium]
MGTKIGLLATARKKLSHPAPVTEFYNSPLFRKSVQYAMAYYERVYFYNAKDGLLLPEQIMQPYDVSIKTFSASEKRQWAKMVIKGLQQYEHPDDVTIYLHGGYVYRKFLEPELRKSGYTYVVPLKGLGIGKQLAWYDRRLRD